MGFFDSYRKESRKRSADEYQEAVQKLYKKGFKGEFEVDKSGRKLKFEIKPIAVKEHERGR